MIKAALIASAVSLLTLAATVTGCAGQNRSGVTKVDASSFLSLDNIGLAAPFAGASNGHLIVAGGTNFPGDPTWKKGTKVWHDEILASDGKTWKQVGKLSPAVAGGASVTTTDGIICIGGGDAKQIYTDVFKLTLKDD